MQTQLQTQNPNSSPVLPAGRHRPAAGLARTLCAAALLAGASAAWGQQQAYTGPLELNFEPQTNGTLLYRMSSASKAWQIPKTGGNFCRLEIAAVGMASSGVITQASISATSFSPNGYVKGDAYLRLKDGSQLRCMSSAMFNISGNSTDSSCLRVGSAFIPSNNKAMKEGFTLVLTPKTFSCS